MMLKLSPHKNEGPTTFTEVSKICENHFDIEGDTWKTFGGNCDDDSHNLNDESDVTTADDKGNECDLQDSSEKQDGRSTEVFVPESKIRN